IEMGGDLVEEEDRAAAGALGDQAGESEDQADQQRLLLPSRAKLRRLALAEMGDDEIGAMRAGKRPAGGGVPRPAEGEGLGQVRLLAAFERQAGARERAFGSIGKALGQRSDRIGAGLGY